MIKVMQIRKIERGFGYASINSMQKLIYNPKLSNKEIPGLIKKTVNTCDVLRDLVPFVQFKNVKHPCRGVTFSRVAAF